MENAIYSPLDTQNDNIRLVHLMPGRFQDPLDPLMLEEPQDPIVCDLKTVRLSDYPNYQALSYVWGTHDFEFPITLCGQPASVTLNLGFALQHIRSAESVRVLWIDALCINQQDLSERTHQVRLMRSIYQNAEKVLIWLDIRPPMFWSSKVNFMATLTSLSSDVDLHWKPCISKNERHLDEDCSTNMAYLFSEDWWKRIWTVQEYVLAKDTTFLIGLDSFSESVLRGLAISFAKHRACCHSLDGGVPLALDRLAQGMTQFHDLHVLRENRKDLTLLEVIARFRHREASNSVDKVFGLLGLIATHDEDLVDYEIAPENIFEATTKRMIGSTGNLDALSHVDFRERTDSALQTLPTWVPDWADGSLGFPTISREIRCRCLPLFGASRNIPAKLAQSKPGVLNLKGLAVDFIDEVGNAAEFWSMGINRAIAQKTYPSGMPWLEATWRTVWMDVDFCSEVEERNLPPYDMQGLNTDPHIKRLPPFPEWQIDAMAIEDSGQTQTQSNKDRQNSSPLAKAHMFGRPIGRKFFLTKKGYMGCAPEEAIVGDMVCILFGGRVPYVLRKVIPTGSNDPLQDHISEHWNFLGDSYVHGLMDGEALDLAENHEVEPRDFILI